MANSNWKNLLLQASENIGLTDFFQRIKIGRDRCVYVLTYHRVAELSSRPWLYPGLISASPRQFEEQMRLVADQYNPISAQDLIDAIRDDRRLPPNAVLVTVDDGYRDFQEEIFPVCSRYGISPLLFIATAFVGAGNFWWDQLYQIIYCSGQDEIATLIGDLPISTDQDKQLAYEQLLYHLKRLPFKEVTAWVDSTHSKFVYLVEDQQHNTLTWDELRQLSRQGVTVACHTHTHPILTQIPLEEARHEVCVAQKIIQKELGYAEPLFSFPDGMPHAFDPDLFRMLFEEGFELLFLLVGGRAHVRHGRRRMVVPRLSVWRSQTLAQFHLRLTPVWDLYESLIHHNERLYPGT